MVQITFFVSFLIILSLIPTAFAQDSSNSSVPGSLEIEFRESDLIIILLGVAGGLTTASLGAHKNKRKMDKVNKIIKEENKKYEGKPSLKNLIKPKEEFVFDGNAFSRTILVAVLTAVPLAIASAALFDKLTLITMFLIYVASIGTSSIAKPGSNSKT